MAFPKPDASVETVILSVTTTSDTQIFSYPTGRNAASYGSGGDHKITGRDFSELSSRLGHITITFGPSNITVVNNTDRTFKAGTVANLILDLAGYDHGEDDLVAGVNAVNLFPVQVYLGAPNANVATGVSLAQTTAGAGNLLINGTVAAAGVATLDIPRNISLTVATTDQSARTITITGTDSQGGVLVESLAGPNNNTVVGKKSFKTITQVATSGALATNGVSVGFSNTLGIPLFVEANAHVVGALQDGATPTAGVTVGGATATATATTGDVRGTYKPNAAANGARVFQLLVLVKSRAYLGVAQFAG